MGNSDCPFPTTSHFPFPISPFQAPGIVGADGYNNRHPMNANPITPAEFQIIEILWSSSRRLSVGDVQAELAESRPLAYTTVMTLLDKMAKKETVDRVKRGKAYFYAPRVSRKEVLDRLIEDFANDFFGGSREELHSFLRGENGDQQQRTAEAPELEVELL